MKNWETQNVNVAGRSVINVFLKTEFADLGEVVVVGNGVVLITTKAGSRSQDGQVFYNGQWQLSSLSRELDVMNAKQYIDYGKKQGFLSDQTLTDVGYVSGTDIN